MEYDNTEGLSERDSITCPYCNTVFHIESSNCPNCKTRIDKILELYEKLDLKKNKITDSTAKKIGGVFHDGEEINDDGAEDKWEIEVVAAPRKDLVKKYGLFKKTINPKADIVYHPCGADDVSPSEVFPSSKIIYADKDKRSMEALKKAKFEAHIALAEEFDPGDVDILIMLNPVVSPEIPSSYVVQNGYILCNDYHSTASYLKSKNEFKLIAIIRQNSKGEMILDFDHPDTTPSLSYYHNGELLTLEKLLPRKKGTVDDIFVFQKI